MRLLLKLVWRNIWRHRRRSLLNILAIVFGLGMIILMVAIQDSSHQQMIDSTINLGTGHIQIRAFGHYEDPAVDKLINNPSQLADQIKSIDAIRSITQRAVAFALLSSGRSSTGGQIIGIQPDKEFIIIPRRIISGSYLSDGDTNSVVIGEQLARNLGLTLGRELIILTQDYYGSVSAAKSIVKGIFRTGIPELDAFQVYMPLVAAQKLLAIEGVHEIVVKLGSPDNVETVKNEVINRIHNNKLEVMTWRELLKSLIQAINIDNAGGYLFLAILLIIVAGSLLNEILMSTLERTREIGILRAVGTSPAQIRPMIILESGLLGILGMVGGVVLGVALSWYFSVFPIHISGLEEAFEEYGLSPYITTKLTMINIVLSSGFILIVSLIAGIIPAYRVSRLSIVKALRFA
ncbi:MAG TPA: hypothetical protein DCS13_12910 [Candidatus Margulisbacteria bacterium]|nr:MAG: hypothetical protein A2X43_04855 [Candidatus Margulisbacteria bacterium GWD2_39_127]HAR64358.1 hypothetical protein [Candidatus Margulisiibacteriota bacterium]